MTRKWLLPLALGSALALPTLPLASSPAQAGVYVGVGVPGPDHGHYYHRHYDHYYYPYYYGPRVVIGAVPVYVSPAGLCTACSGVCATGPHGHPDARARSRGPGN